MDPITKGFENDLDKIVNQLDFIEVLHQFSSCVPNVEEENTSRFFIDALALHVQTKKIRGSLPIISGTLILYTCGRFEAMTRTLFEDLCQRLVTRAGTFARLPKKMRENLPVFTAKVISDPRKYGHAENGVRAFVATLAANLEVDAKVESVNHKCLSLTEGNMRADTLSDLFERIGVIAIWKQISQQAALKAHFQNSDSDQVENKAKRGKRVRKSSCWHA